uniref:Reverse transcriptase zinc-binding domain-containing protein n=1 Tax=Oryza sativa subsp. japonica TaxID=39947 RepID=Q69W53_ORYSJ|nr:hypothetical protein [Oryza sativa Japonica Group]
MCTSSAYHAQCLGAPSTNLNSLIWKAWAPGKCKFHAWLIIQNRVWTSDRLAIRGWQNNGHCPLCRCEANTQRESGTTLPDGWDIINWSRPSGRKPGQSANGGKA